MFLQGVLKQTQPYLEKRGVRAAEKARQGMQDADAGAAKAVADIENANTEERNFDL